MDDGWDADQANRILRETLEGIGELEDKLSPARAEALLLDDEPVSLSSGKRIHRVVARKAHQPIRA